MSEGSRPENRSDHESSYSLVVDGETFIVRRRTGARPPFEYDYEWLTGPEPHYGFSSSISIEKSNDQHRATIEEFLRGRGATTRLEGRA